MSGDYIIIGDKKYLSFCKENCNRLVTKEDVIYDVEFGCNFCDVPYILLGEYGD